MTTSNRHGTGIILLSFVIALILTVIPLPSWLSPFRPEWVALLVVYWCITTPHRVGVGWAWALGITLDVLRGALFAQHALGLTAIAYLALKLHQRVRLYPLWQQALTIMILVTFYQLLVLWVNGLIGKPAKTWTYWLPSITSMLFWPVLYMGMLKVRRHFRIN